MVILRHEVQTRCAPAMRARVWRRLVAHPAVAYRLLATWSPAAVHAVTCGATARLPPAIPASPSVTSLPTTVTSAPTPSTGVAPSAMGVPGSWHLTRSDEFAGPAVGTTKWSTGWFGSGVTGPVNSYEQECDDPSQVAVTGGSLNLTAIATTQLVNGTTSPGASGIVTTMGKFTVTDGVVEAQGDLSGTNGQIDNWRAVWADETGRWPATGELEVMEGLGGSAADHVHSSLSGPGCKIAGNFTGWHTSAPDWQPGVVT
jgi:hypothetical protein